MEVRLKRSRAQRPIVLVFRLSATDRRLTLETLVSLLHARYKRSGEAVGESGRQRRDDSDEAGGVRRRRRRASI